MANTASPSDRSDEQPWTVLRLLEWTTGYFKTKGSDSPRLDAEVLLAHARDCPRINLYAAFNEVPPEEQLAAFREMVRRRGGGAPVAQLVGYREFYSLRFRVDSNTLVPRPETEHLVTEAIDFSKKVEVSDRPKTIADIGTGSGVIAVTLAKQMDDVVVHATDISEPAIDIARWNAEQMEVADRVHFHLGDLLSPIDPANRFDLICSNPPYVSASEYAELDATVRDHEPESALLAGDTGTEVIQRLLDDAPERLTSGGGLMIELSPMIAETCVELANQSGHYTDVRLVKDLAGHHRVLVARTR